MASQNNTKSAPEKPAAPAKSFMTIGPTLHYSHPHVRRYWGLTIIIFLAACLLWSRILTGQLLAVDLTNLIQSRQWGLAKYIINPLSIYEYPWQILTLGLIMGIFAITPVLISQMLSFRYAIVFILMIIFIAKLPIFALAVTLSCIAVACRPLRFRSRFISVALCLTPQLIFWAAMGGYETEPIKWGFSYAPWIVSWLTALATAGFVIAVGHYTRYRPGMVWSTALLILVASAALFEWKISFAELDYQLYIAGNNPEEVEEFHDHDMTSIINNAMDDPQTRQFLANFFYPQDPKLLREELKSDILIQLGYDRWPNWFNTPDQLNYQQTRMWLLSQYDIFIEKRPISSRMPIALYYKAILKEYTPDLRLFKQKEILRFYNDYPHRENRPIWYKLYSDFPQSPESIEARWRMAVRWAGQGEFDKARETCEVARILLNRFEESQQYTPSVEAGLLSAFTKPPKTAITRPKRNELRIRLGQLTSLISKQNHNNNADSKKRLSRFILLNPHTITYSQQLEILISETPENDPLKDNLLLVKILMTEDDAKKAEMLNDFIKKFHNTDSAANALYELGVTYTQLWRNTPDNKKRQSYLKNARTLLAKFLTNHPENVYRNDANERLKILPQN